MHRAIIGVVAAFAVPSIWSLPASAADALTTVPREGCVEVKVAAEPNKVKVGGAVKAMAAVANCGRRWDFIKVVLQLRRGDAQRLIQRWAFRLGPGMARELMTRFEAPRAGKYRVIVIAKSRRGGFARASANLLVVE